ncbi:LysM peptidoglycan-binding domain-containing protein [Georgenia phoenicis]|uniref:LysM peptidoglycan-binding domain-containing protein n=1 Tax=unclassified Georgenia TaxID=2626815 RepID=UPI0039AF84DF
MLRTAALAALTTLVTVLLGGWAGELAARGVVRVDDAVAIAAAAGGTLVAAWYALTATALLLAHVAELGRRAPRLARGLRAAVGTAGAPVLRRAAVVGMGAGLALAALPASAGTTADDAVPHDLRPGIGSLASPEPSADGEETAGEPTPEPSPVAADQPPAETPPTQPPPPPDTPARAQPTPAAPDATVPAPSPAGSAAAVGSARQEAPVAAPVGTARGAPAAPTPSRAAHVVRPGDSLWSIARARLGPEVTDAQVAAEWPRWYATNRAVIGADPHLIHPGQTLQAPEPKEQR